MFFSLWFALYKHLKLIIFCSERILDIAQDPLPLVKFFLRFYSPWKETSSWFWLVLVTDVWTGFTDGSLDFCFSQSWYIQEVFWRNGGKFDCIKIKLSEDHLTQKGIAAGARRNPALACCVFGCTNSELFVRDFCISAHYLLAWVYGCCLLPCFGGVSDLGLAATCNLGLRQVCARGIPF